MARDWQINGPVMLKVKGNPNTAMAALSLLGQSDAPIRVRHNFRHMDLNIDSAGGEVPVEHQIKLQDVMIDMTLVHWDPLILDAIVEETMGGGSAPGVMPLAGARMGNGADRLAVGWHYVSLNVPAPVNGRPHRFLNCYLTGQPYEIPLGAERSVLSLSFRCIPYMPDPYADGAFTQGYVLYDNTLDN